MSCGVRIAIRTHIWIAAPRSEELEDLPISGELLGVEVFVEIKWLVSISYPTLLDQEQDGSKRWSVLWCFPQIGRASCRERVF